MEILALDIGGTNTRLGIFRNLELLKKNITPTRDVSDLGSLINRFRKGFDIRYCTIGFAGLIIGNKAKLTNADLEINTKTLMKATGMKITLLNDFHCIGKGIMHLKGSDFRELNPGRLSNKVEMVIGPGTGLGKSYVINDETYPCEAGQTTIGIENIEEYALLDYLKKRNFDPAYYEDIISGRGLIHIYDHMEIKSNIEFNMDIRNKIRRMKIKNASIITENSDKDKLCKMTLQTFVKFFARFARDSALHLIPSQIYLGGGISPQIVKHLEKDFMKEFVKHRSYSSLLKKIGIKVILNTDVGLIGAASTFE